MTRIAVIQNGTDVARSSWADTAELYRECARIASDEGTTLTVQFYADEAVGPLLAGLDPQDVACVVFSTNALTSGQVQQRVARHRDRFHDYVAGGGGVVILHQWLDSLDAVLPMDRCPAMVDRITRGPAATPVHRLRRDDVLLHYPAEIDLDRLRDGGHDSGPSWFFFKAFEMTSLPDAFKAVLVADDEEAVLLRTDDHVTERIVLCSALLDWQGNVDLLANAVRWAAFGSPQRLVIRSGNATVTTVLHRWLCLDGLSTVMRSPTGAGFSDAGRWLLTDAESRVEVLVVPPEDLERLGTNAEAREFLRRGGTVLTTDAASSSPASRITALVGDYGERALAASLYAELRAVDGWHSLDSAFDLRNIAACAAALWQDPPNRTPAAVAPDELLDLRGAIFERLSEPRHREDVASSIALAQIVAVLGAGEKPDLALMGWMFETPLARSFEVHLQLLAVRAGWTGEPAIDFLARANADLASAPPLNSISAVVRLLDSVALLHQLHLLPSDPVGTAALATGVADALDAFPPAGDAGWLSIEGTADVVRGLVTLVGRLPAEEMHLATRLATFTVIGTDAIRRSMRGYERNVRGVAWRARLTHALVLADRAFPNGLQRLATLRWPAEGRAESSRTVAERSLVEHLAAENRRLDAVRGELAAAADSKDALLAEQRRAAAFGRGVATWVPTLLLVGGGIGVALRVGSDSFWALLANVGVLCTALLTVLTLLFAGLAQLHLLAPQAQAVKNALEQSAVPLLKSLGQVKGRSRPG